MSYYWKEGYRGKADPNVAGEVCANLEKSIGLTAKNLVDVSRPDDAPLHNEFEWDDSVAAEKFRETQAGCIIRHITVIVEKNDGQKEPTRAFVNLKTEDQHYENVHAVIKDTDKYSEYKRMALRELAAFQKKYSQIKELAPVFEAIETVERAETA